MIKCGIYLVPVIFHGADGAGLYISQVELRTYTQPMFFLGEISKIVNIKMHKRMH